MLKREKIAIKTISLPLKIAQRVEYIARKSNVTVSDIFRESFRFYEREYTLQSHKASGYSAQWKTLKSTLKRIARQGKKVRLSSFIVADRNAH